MTEPRAFVRKQQQQWAARSGIQFDADGYVVSLDKNLFVKLSAAARREFASGRGAELGVGGARGKMQALHSSSALVYNFFEYWRDRDMSNISRACGHSGNPTLLVYEAQHPTGLPGAAPHLDVELKGLSCEPLCIEAKFTEPYPRVPPFRTMRESYFTTAGVWTQLPRCREIAATLRHSGKRSRLDTPQLLKHVLGLRRAYGLGNFHLLYLWYDVPSAEADEHRPELAEFEQALDGEVPFCHRTYQQVFAAIRDLPEVDPKYVTLLGDRYFHG